jgi:hypothetical protein
MLISSDAVPNTPAAAAQIEGLAKLSQRSSIAEMNVLSSSNITVNTPPINNNSSSDSSNNNNNGNNNSTDNNSHGSGDSSEGGISSGAIIALGICIPVGAISTYLLI